MPDPIGWAVLMSVRSWLAGRRRRRVRYRHHHAAVVAWAIGISFGGPVLTVAMLVGKSLADLVSRGEVDRAVVVRFALGAVPATALGTAFFAGVPAEWLGRFAGVFLISSVPLRRLLATDFVRMRLRYFPALGAFIGLLSAMVVTTGPLNTPFFPVVRPAPQRLVGTEAVCSMAMHLARGATLARYALLTREGGRRGLVLGGTMFAGRVGGAPPARAHERSRLPRPHRGDAGRDGLALASVPAVKRASWTSHRRHG